MSAQKSSEESIKKKRSIRKKNIDIEKENIERVIKNEEEAIAMIAKLLAFSVREDQVKWAARRLYRKFGSIYGVMYAPKEDILEIGSGMEPTVELLSIFQKLNKRYLEDYNEDVQRVYDMNAAVRLLIPKFLGRRTEAVVLMLMDGRSGLLYNEVVNEGSVTEVPIYVRKMVELCLRYNAYDAIIAHNHPSGNVLPSRNDLTATRDVERALSGIDVNLVDHFIISGRDYTSFNASDLLSKIKIDIEEYHDVLRQRGQEEGMAMEYLLERIGRNADLRADEEEDELDELDEFDEWDEFDEADEPAFED